MIRNMLHSQLHRSEERSTAMRRIARFALLLACLQPLRLYAEESDRRERDLFENHVRPTLVRHCIQCHGDAKQEGNLQLTSREGLLTGGDSGPAIVPGKPDESLLLEAMRYESYEMPPSGPLDDGTIAGMAHWIRAGAPWPAGLKLAPTPAITEQDRAWWCYQPLSDPAVPEVNDGGWCRNEIDCFVFDRLQRDAVMPAAEADPRTLARRVHFAVTGLPPSDATAAALGGDGWYEALVDQLLQDRAYGENQARYWLDLVRYADSDGYNADHGRPEAYRYRDYVIESFHADKPYDRFVLEQLAGDEIDPGNRDALIGTMYLRHWIYEWNQRDVEGQWQQILSDVTETTADVFLAQGLKCARCHDHKFDPLLQKDYYAFKAFFTPLQPREDQPIADLETRVRYEQQMDEWASATADIRRRLHEIESPVLLAHATREGFSKFTREIRSMISRQRQDRSPYEHQIASLASRQFDLHPDKLPEWLDRETERERQRLRQQLAEFDHLKPEPLPTLKFVASDVGPVAPPTTIPDSGDPTPIAPAFPEILHDAPVEIQPPHEALQSTGRRTALARWIIAPDNPLTARVMVNRIWQQHFGRGLVATTSDFGHLGTRPSHPELLDWLAQRFIRDGWSLKKLHRLILTSATYRQSSTRLPDERLAELDPQNELLWRMNPRRLSGEELHDCLLSASEELKPGKRAIYKPVKRNKLDPLLAAFDFPDRVESACQRHRTTTSPQSLLLMNDPWLHERAQTMAARLSGSSLESLVQSAWQKLYFREPDSDALRLAAEFVESYLAVTPERELPSRLGTLPDGRPALALDAEQPASISVPAIRELQPETDDASFTIEATVMLHSLYPDASVRTIVTSWSGRKSDRGWSLGVTSTKSAYKPRNLILQLVGSRAGDSDRLEYEVVPSNLRMELNRPYHVAVSIDPGDTSPEGITFSLRDLSRPDAEPQTAHAPHQARRGIQAPGDILIGGRSDHHHWDGLLHSIRIHRGELGADQLFRSKPAEPGDSSAGPAAELLADVQFSDDSQLGRDISGNGYHAVVQFDDGAILSPQEQARAALLHACLCANETIYVD